MAAPQKKKKYKVIDRSEEAWASSLFEKETAEHEEEEYDDDDTEDDDEDDDDDHLLGEDDDDYENPSLNIPCAFFNTETGCSHGKDCMFSHSTTTHMAGGGGGGSTSSINATGGGRQEAMVSNVSSSSSSSSGSSSSSAAGGSSSEESEEEEDYSEEEEEEERNRNPPRNKERQVMHPSAVKMEYYGTDPSSSSSQKRKKKVIKMKSNKIKNDNDDDDDDDDDGAMILGKEDNPFLQQPNNSTSTGRNKKSTTGPSPSTSPATVSGGGNAGGRTIVDFRTLTQTMPLTKMTTKTTTGDGNTNTVHHEEEEERTTPRPNKKNKKQRESSSSSSDPTTPPAMMMMQHQQPAATDPAPAAGGAVMDFRSLTKQMPVASFTVGSVENPNKTTDNTPTKNKSERNQQTTSTKDEQQRQLLPERRILPTSSPIARKWIPYVQRTWDHPRYNDCYDFNSIKEKSSSSSSNDDDDNNEQEQQHRTTWIKARPYGQWCANNPQVIAIDCEMSETKCPTSGKTNPTALVRISIINGENPSEVLLDTLVKPSWPVSDYRSRINGITKTHLSKVEFTLKHAQELLMALCSSETVIIGHALQNDLKSLRMEHYCNVDTSLLFPVTTDDDNNDGRIVPSLKDTIKAVTGKDMPQIHDSVNDARTAYQCAEYFRTMEGNVDPILRTKKVKRTNTPDLGVQLFVHRIPRSVRTEHLSPMFLMYTHVSPTEVKEIEFKDDKAAQYGKTHVVFPTRAHADLCFETLGGKVEVDKGGLPQKRVFLKNDTKNEYIRVRKMIRPTTTTRKSSDGEDGGTGGGGGGDGDARNNNNNDNDRNNSGGTSVTPSTTTCGKKNNNKKRRRSN